MMSSLQMDNTARQVKQSESKRNAGGPEEDFFCWSALFKVFKILMIKLLIQ